MENYLVVLHLLGKKQEILFWWYHTQIRFGQLQQTQFDIFHTRMLQNTSGCHVAASIWILLQVTRNNRILKINNHNFTNFGQFEVIFA